jgi:hypothetical protein
MKNLKKLTTGGDECVYTPALREGQMEIPAGEKTFLKPASCSRASLA